MAFAKTDQARGMKNDAEWLKGEFRRHMGRELDLVHPSSFNEKLQVYKLIYRDPLLTTLSDKYAVRAYVSETIGPDHLIPLIGCYDSVDEIPIHQLPDKFIIKATHGSAWNLICDDKQAFDWAAAKANLETWLGTDYSLAYGEWGYRGVPPRIVIEALLQDQNGSIPPDYKIYCFHGRPKLIQVEFDRFGDHTSAFLDTNWVRLPFTAQFPHHPHVVSRPKILDEMLDSAARLSKGIPFVRVDLLALDAKVYFGEMTFYPGAGYKRFNPPVWDEILGGWFDVSSLQKDAPHIHAAPRSEYELNDVVSVSAERSGFEFLTSPRDTHRFGDVAFEERSAVLLRQNAMAAAAFVDIGAHHGASTVMVAKSNPNCEVVAFEPVPENCAILRKNLAVNGVRASIHEAAVSDVTTRLPFQVSERTTMSGFVGNPEAPLLRSIEVDVVRLDQFLSEIPDGPTLIKIDTRGNEPRVLDGMQDLIRTRGDVRLLLTLHPQGLKANGYSPEDVLRRLDELGFDAFVLCDPEPGYVRYKPGSDWNDYAGEGPFRDLFCVKKDRSLNIVFVAHSSQLGGSERSLLQAVTELVQDYGAICTVCLPGPGPMLERLQNIAAATIVGHYSWWCSSWERPAPEIIRASYQDSFAWIRSALPQLRRVAPDVIFSNTLTIPWGAILASSLDRPHLWRVSEFGKPDHGLEFDWPFLNIREFIAGSSSVVVTCSEAVRKELFLPLGVDNVKTIHTHIDGPPRASGSPMTAAFLDAQATKLLSLGTIWEFKGQKDAVLAAIELIKVRGRRLELLICGVVVDTVYFDELKQLVADAQLEDRIRFAPFEPDIFPILDQADMILLCSHQEAFSRVGLEAMLIGKALIGTGTGGTLELIDDGKNGLLYQPGDIRRLADQIQRLIDEPTLRRNLADQGQRSASRRFTRANFGGNFYAILKSLKHEPNSLQDSAYRILDQFHASAFAEMEQIAGGLQARLDEIERSRAWKLVQLLRRIRSKLAPPDGRASSPRRGAKHD
ncbi:MAG TPA: FkbM family methyltransferase [Anaerolineales bacterium]